MIPEKQIKILSTKKISETLVQQAKAENILIDEINFIETKPVETPAVVEKIKYLSKQKITAVFTSVHAVEAVFSQINTKPDWKVFCISGKTKNAVLKHLSEDAIIDTAMNATVLTQKIIANKSVKSCVFFCSNIRLGTMPLTLALNGIRYDELVVYETVLLSKEINETYAGIVFYSPSGAKSFFLANKIGRQTVIFSIGKTTTNAIKKFSSNVVVTAEKPSAESILKEIRNYFDTENL